MKDLKSLIRHLLGIKPKFKNPHYMDPNPNKRYYTDITLKDLNQFQWNGPDFKQSFPMK